VRFVIGQWIGALLAGIVGHASSLKHDDRTERQASNQIDLDSLLDTRRVAFSTAIIVLAAKLSKVDGRVNQDEIQAFRRIFDISDDDVGSVAAVYNEAKRSPDGFEPSARRVAAVFGTERAMLEELLCGLFEVAVADGAIDEEELRFLREVGSIFGFGPFQFEAIRARYMFSQQAGRPGRIGADPDHYAALGLTRDAADEEIRQTWLALVREHHPDRLIARGLPLEFVAKANQHLAAINAAYDRIAAERGFRR
jgi:DnaJ like chaperone protein